MYVIVRRPLVANENGLNQPKYHAYRVRERYDRGEVVDSFFVRLGSAFEHKDGKGLTILLDALPVDGKLVLREPKPKEDENADERSAEQYDEEPPAKPRTRTARRTRAKSA